MTQTQTINELKKEVYEILNVRNTTEVKNKLSDLNSESFSNLNLSLKKNWIYLKDLLPEFVVKKNSCSLQNKSMVAYEKNNHSNFFFYSSEQEYLVKVKQVFQYLGYIPVYNTCSRYNFLKEYNKENLNIRG